MNRYFAYYAIFIVSLGGGAICTDDEPRDVYQLLHAQNVNGQGDLGEVQVCFSPSNEGLVFYQKTEAKPEGQLTSDSQSLIKYTAITGIRVDSRDVVLTYNSSEVVLSFKNAARANYFLANVEELLPNLG